MLRRDGVVHIIILQQTVRCLDEEKLEDAFDDDLPEDPALILECESWGEGGRFLSSGSEGGGRYELLEWGCRYQLAVPP
jgi:hypothetical protein